MTVPDIVVFASDGTRVVLVAEAKLRLAKPARATKQLHDFMQANSCPTGLLVTPSQIQIFVQSPTGPDFEMVGSIPTMTVFSLPENSDNRPEIDLERALQDWVESLVTGRPEALPSGERDRTLLERYVLSAVAGGRVVPQPHSWLT